jgi:biotin operon repressor
MRWEAVQAAKCQGLSGRAIARELRISRNTVLKYLVPDKPKLISIQQ